MMQEQSLFAQVVKCKNTNLSFKQECDEILSLWKKLGFWYRVSFILLERCPNCFQYAGHYNRWSTFITNQKSNHKISNEIVNFYNIGRSKFTFTLKKIIQNKTRSEIGILDSVVGVCNYGNKNLATRTRTSVENLEN